MFLPRKAEKSNITSHLSAIDIYTGMISNYSVTGWGCRELTISDNHGFTHESSVRCDDRERKLSSSPNLDEG